MSNKPRMELSNLKVIDPDGTEKKVYLNIEQVEDTKKGRVVHLEGGFTINLDERAKELEKNGGVIKTLLQ